MPTLTPQVAIHRIEVRCKPGHQDPRALSVERRARALGYPVQTVGVAKVYLIEAALDVPTLRRVLASLLSDPVIEIAGVGAAPALGARTIEVHPLPGVMDPVAQSVASAIRELTGSMPVVSTGLRYDFPGLSDEQAGRLARDVLANPVVHQITQGPWLPTSLPGGHAYQLTLRHVPLLTLTDEQLVRLSRDAHLFLSLEEMRAIQGEYRRIKRDPTDIELETLAQTWSEHCVHKTLKSTVRYVPGAPGETKRSRDDVDPNPSSLRLSVSSLPTSSLSPDPINWHNRPGHTVNTDGSVTINNLLKSTIAAATFDLIDEGIDWTLSVFKDNSGIVALDENYGVCIKVETHNHPSALEPYGGAATGAGGCIRDVIGTGLGAKPIANTDVFCVAFPGHWKSETARQRDSETVSSPLPLPPGTLHPRRILTDVVAGVRDYGNRMGIPTLNGAVAFDDRYVGNPLVFCGCIGLIPRRFTHGQARKGDRIIALGGRTGRDGIHGATFSSAELEQGHADEFSHAVQIGNAIEEKRVLDAILRARDFTGGPLYTAMTDCGAGGFSSAVGEMGKDLGAQVHLDGAPVKYAGLSYTEIWISEAQERMVLSVPPKNLEALKKICQEEHVELADLGHFGTDNAELVLFYNDIEVGRLSMHFVHDGIPTPTREATWGSETARQRDPETGKKKQLSVSIADSLCSLLSHPNIASKHWIIRQYDHEVQGNTILKPLVGPGGRGPGDAAVLEPIAGSNRGIAIASGLQTPLGDPLVPGSDPYHMALAAIDECIRNLVCVGGDPTRTAILDNFCWPSCAKPENMGSLVRAAEGCYDAAKAYRTPFVSGKDSLNNQLRYTDPNTGKQVVVEVPPTLLITGLAQVPDISRVTTMDAKKPGNQLVLVGAAVPHMSGSVYSQLYGGSDSTIPTVDLTCGPATARAVAQCIQNGLVASAHDCSEGGLLVAVAEMLIATTGTARSALGAELTPELHDLSPHQLAFAESPSRYVIEVSPADLPKLLDVLNAHGRLQHSVVGTLNTTGRLNWAVTGMDVKVDDLAAAWLKPLNW